MGINIITPISRLTRNNISLNLPAKACYIFGAYQSCKMLEISWIQHVIRARLSCHCCTIRHSNNCNTTSPKPLSPPHLFVPNRRNTNPIFNHSEILQQTLPIIAPYCFVSLPHLQSFDARRKKHLFINTPSSHDLVFALTPFHHRPREHLGLLTSIIILSKSIHRSIVPVTSSSDIASINHRDDKKEGTDPAREDKNSCHPTECSQ